MSTQEAAAPSNSFTALRRNLSARGELIAEATGTPVVPPPRALPLTDLQPNPYNPRITLKALRETATSLEEVGQIQAITIVTRGAFIAAHPSVVDDPDFTDAPYVVIDGNRRLAAAGMAGLEQLRFDLNDDLAQSAVRLLEASLISNLGEAVPPIEEAAALASLVKVHGSNREVGRRLGKTHVYVGQRLALLGLLPELQDEVNEGTLLVEDGRQIGRLPHNEQLAAAELAKQARAAAAERTKEARVARKADRGETDAGNGVSTATPPADSDSDQPDHADHADETDDSGHGQTPTDDDHNHDDDHKDDDHDHDAQDDDARAPRTRPRPPGVATAVSVDFGDMSALAELLRGRLGRDQLQALIELLLPK